MSPKVLDLAREGKITEGHARSLLTISDPETQYAYAIRIIENGDSVRTIENRTKKKLQNTSMDERNQILYRDIEDKFQGFFGTKVKVDAGKRSGKIVIQYKTNRDLERILELLK